MKKTILGTLISMSCFSVLASGEFTIIIDKKNNEYINATTIKETTDWSTISTSCVFDKETSEIYHGISFQQEETCTEKQEREIITITKYPDGTQKEISRIKEIQDKEFPSVINTKVGTHLESTCKDILDNGFSIGDNNYVISQSGNPTVFCDMTRNDGGWMRVVNHDWYSNKTAPNNQFQVTTNRIIKDYGNINRYHRKLSLIHQDGE